MYRTGNEVLAAIKIKLGFACLFGYFLLLTTFENCLAGRPQLCNRFENGVDESVGFEEVKPLLGDKCPAFSTGFRIYSLENADKFDSPQLVVCWSKGIRRAALQFDESVAVGNKRPHDRYLAETCTKSNDTILLSRQRIRQAPYFIHLTIPAISGRSYIFKVFVDRRTRSGRKVTPHVQYYKYTPLVKTRVKRDVNESSFDVTDQSECGKTKGCFRKGYNNCGHMNCTYFLSYNATTEKGNLEISARTDGWVAVGFSSDEYMGDDEIVMCRKKPDSSSELEAASYRARSGHNTPQRMDDNIVLLNHYRVSDDAIYCSVTVPFSVVGHQDLSNEWFRLYAYGSLTNGGSPQKHKVLPTVSNKKLDLFYKSNIIVSGMSRSTASFLVCLIVLGCNRMFSYS